MANINNVYTHSLYPSNSPGFLNPQRYDVNISSKAIPNARILVVDSRTRNHGLDGAGIKEPNDYTAFFTDYKDVIAVELVNVYIPNSGYTIETTNNVLRFNDGTNTYDVEIPVGNYSSEGFGASDTNDLLYVIEESMNDTPSTHTFTVSYYDVTSLITISATADFSLIFNSGTQPHGINADTESRAITNTIADVIGFARQTFSGASTYTAPYTYNLRTNKYIIMNIEGLERIDSPSSAIHKAFCVIILDDNTSNFKMNTDFKDIDNDAYTVYFPEPQPRLDRFRIKFFDIDGNLYNFHGHDHILTFKISTKNNSEY